MASLRQRLARRLYVDWPGLGSLAVASRDALLEVTDLLRTRGDLRRAGLAGECHCGRCGVDARIPGVWLDGTGTCGECLREPRTRGRGGPARRDRIDDPSTASLLTPRTDGGVDAVVALSGGKDSLTALVLAVEELGLRVSALTLDNGFLLEPALDACREWCERLAVPLRIVRDPMHAVVAGALRRRNLVPWPCVACFDRLSRALVDEASRVGAATIVTGLRYRWPRSGKAIAPASEAFAAYAPRAHAAALWVVNLPAALALDEAEERELLGRRGWTDPGLAGHSTNCLLPARFESLHRERLGRPHDSARFVALEARQDVITADVARARARGEPPSAAHLAELDRRLARGATP